MGEVRKGEVPVWQCFRWRENNVGNPSGKYKKLPWMGGRAILKVIPRAREAVLRWPSTAHCRRLDQDYAISRTEVATRSERRDARRNQ